MPYLKNNQNRRVEVVTHDSYFKEMNPGIEPIDFMKIDAEGFEFEVLRGAQNITRLHRPKAVQLEFNHNLSFRGHSINLFSCMLPVYPLFQMHPKARIPRDPKDPYANIFLFPNFLIVNDDCLSSM